MFFKKKEPIKPSKEQVAKYGKHIYAILGTSGDITLFDNLVCDSFAYFYMIEKSEKSKFLVANSIAKIDAIIATAYVNALIFINGVNSIDIKQQYTNIYFKKVVQVIRKEYPEFSSFIEAMFSSRIALYNSVTEKYDSNLQSMIDCVFEELQYVLSFDKVEQIYKPYTKTSPLVILDFIDHMTCQGEIIAYKNICSSLYKITNEQINHVLISMDTEAIKKTGSVYYEALKKALSEGLEKYIKKHPSQILKRFGYSLDDYFSLFFNEEPSEEYAFSISVQNEASIEYVEFNFEKCVLEVICGGSIYSPSVGSDSYTNWLYSMWDDGSEENNGISVESFDIIYEILSSENARISIDSPDEFYYYPEMEITEIDSTGLQTNIQNIINDNVIDIPSLWDMEPSHHGRKVRIYGYLDNEQTDTFWCTLYAEHYRGYSSVGRVELKVNLVEPLPQFLWKKPRIYKTEIPMVGTLVYDPVDCSYGLMDAKYDEYWRDEKGNILCIGIDCLHDCSEQCPIHCNNIAKALVDKADYEGAISVLKQVTKKTLDYADNWLLLARCYLKLSLHEEAEDAYFKVLELDKTNKQAMQELCIVSLRLGRFANAQKYAAICSRNKNDTRFSQINQLIQEELLQYSNHGLTYNIPDTIWDLIYQENSLVYWDMVLAQKLSSLVGITSVVSVLEYKQQWQNLRNDVIGRDSVVKMRAALKEEKIENAKAMCIFDVIVTYRKKFIQY